MESCTACFIGHRNIEKSEEIRSKLIEIIEKLIIDKNVDTFLFGSKSQFNDLCLEVVSRIKENHPHIKRVYVRAEYPYINDTYKKYLLKFYDETYYPEKISNSGKATYVERNFEMINNSHFCVFYYNEENPSITYKSGTKIAFDYAKKINKKTIRV